MDLLSLLGGWAEAHPTMSAVVVIPALTAVFNLIFKPKTPDQYAQIAAVSPRLAGFLQMMGALGVDGEKASRIFFEKIVKGPPKPPRGPSSVPSSYPPPPSVPPSAARAALVGICLSLGIATNGCSLLTKQTAKTALDAVAVACIFQSELADESALADACEVAHDLIPLIKKLIGQRDAAKRTGVHWSSPSDAGVDR